MKTEQIAEICHEVNNALIYVKGGQTLPWSLAEEIIRESARSGVKYHLENPDVSAEESHQKWMEYKLAEGWVRGDIKDVAEKTHPNLVPYNELDSMERLKDVLFKAVVDFYRGEHTDEVSASV